MQLSKILAGVSAIVVSVVVCQSSAGAAELKFALHTIEQQVVDQTNAQRARYGLPALVVEPALVQTARAHTTWMTSRRTLRHTSRPVAENIAMGQRSAPEVLQSWMSSSGHRANILNRNHRRIGVAAYTASDGNVYWCQQFSQ